MSDDTKQAPHTPHKPHKQSMNANIGYIRQALKSNNATDLDLVQMDELMVQSNRLLAACKDFVDQMTTMKGDRSLPIDDADGSYAITPESYDAGVAAIAAAESGEA